MPIVSEAAVEVLDVTVPIPGLKSKAILRLPYPMSPGDFTRVVKVLKSNLKDMRDAIVNGDSAAAQMDLDSDWGEGMEDNKKG